MVSTSQKLNTLLIFKYKLAKSKRYKEEENMTDGRVA
jgi:hypothetical protein